MINVPLSAMSITTSLACTSMTTNAPSVILACADNFPLTSLTISPSWAFNFP